MCLITSRIEEDPVPPRRVYRDKATGAYFSEPGPRRSHVSSTSARRGHTSSTSARRSHASSTGGRLVHDVREVRHVYPARSSSRASYTSQHSIMGTQRSVTGTQPVVVVPAPARSVRSTRSTRSYY